MVTTNRKLKNCGGLQAPTQHQKHSILQHKREPGITVNSAKMCIQAPTQAQKKHSLLLWIVHPSPNPGDKNTVFYCKFCIQAPTQHQKHSILQHKREPVYLDRCTFACKVDLLYEILRFLS